MTAGRLSLEPLPSSCFNVMPVTSQPEQLMCFELGWGSWGRGRLGAGEEEMSRERGQPGAGRRIRILKSFPLHPPLPLLPTGCGNIKENSSTSKELPAV